MKNFLISLTLGLFFLAFAFTGTAFAADFKVEINKTYTLNSPGEVEVVETRKVINNSTTSLISGNNNEAFQIIVISGKQDKLQPSLLSAEAFVDGEIRQFEQGSSDEDSLSLTIPYNNSIGIGQSREFKLKYTNYGLTETTGALLDIFAPGFSKDFMFVNENTEFVYSTFVKINNSLGEVNFAVPESAVLSAEAGYSVYTINPEDLVGSNIWIQIGKTQYYQFKLTQQVKASDNINKGYFNEYSLVIPRNINETEVLQKVYFSKFDPEPKQIIEDEEGNLVATFKVPSHHDSLITVTGYGEVSKTGNEVNSQNSGETEAIDIQQQVKYLNPGEFWEVDHPEIRTRAAELKEAENNVYAIVKNTYEHIVDTIDYSEVKRFGINERQGALKTLRGGAAVCMEYSDLFLALSRAQKIPARAVFGYGYDARLGEDEQDAHQWVQVYIPEQDNWISVDVTWGESGPALIGGDLNHFYTHVAAVDPNTPPSVQRTSYGKPVELTAPEFEIQAIKSIPGGEVLTTQTDVLSAYPKSDKNELELLVDDLTLRIQTANIPASVTRNAQYVVYAGFGLIALAGVLFLKLMVEVFLKKREKLKS